MLKLKNNLLAYIITLHLFKIQIQTAYFKKEILLRSPFLKVRIPERNVVAPSLG